MCPTLDHGTGLDRWDNTPQTRSRSGAPSTSHRWSHSQSIALSILQAVILDFPCATNQDTGADQSQDLQRDTDRVASHAGFVNWMGVIYTQKHTNTPYHTNTQHTIKLKMNTTPWSHTHTHTHTHTHARTHTCKHTCMHTNTQDPPAHPTSSCAKLHC